MDRRARSLLELRIGSLVLGWMVEYYRQKGHFNPEIPVDTRPPAETRREHLLPFPAKMIEDIIDVVEKTFDKGRIRHL